MLFVEVKNSSGLALQVPQLGYTLLARNLFLSSLTSIFVLQSGVTLCDNCNVDGIIVMKLIRIKTPSNVKI